jgi:thiaminase (transcriptional activator TenA)
MSKAEHLPIESAFNGKQHFTDWLKAGNLALWNQMVGHRFCRDMAEDRLSEEVFVRYLRFEHAFVRTVVAVFAYALAKAPTPADQDHLLGVLNALAGEQQSYFGRTFSALRLHADVLPDDAIPQTACRLRENVLAIAASSGFEEILSAMLAAEWMYLTWCEKAHSQQPRQRAPADWIRLHVEPGFRAQVTWLKSRLNVLGPRLDPSRQGRCQTHFGCVLECEIAFHDAPYEPT